jgi:hypothetical protein
MKARITIAWESALLKNQAYVAGDMKLGHTAACQKAMWDIVMLLRPAVGYGFKWNGNRIQVTITAYLPRTNIDAQNTIAAISDAVEIAIGVDDSNFDVSAIGKLDKDNPRIVIEVSQTKAAGQG